MFIELAKQGIDNLMGGIEGISMGKFDYGGQYSLQDASNYGAERGSKIGGMFGPLGKTLGSIIGKKVAEKRAGVVLDNRTQKMDELLDLQKSKIKQAELFKASDFSSDLNIEI